MMSFVSGSGSYPVEECPYEEAPTVTSMMITAEDIQVSTTAIVTAISTLSTITATSTVTVTSTPSTTVITITMTASTTTTVTLTSAPPITTVPIETTGPPIVPIVISVLGGMFVVSIIIVLLVWRHILLFRLGIKRSNRVALIATYTSTSDGTVLIDGLKNDGTSSA
jgi:hypothetical protein